MLIKPTNPNLSAKIIICGVGGAGTNAINSMVASGEIQGVQFVAINTDAQVLALCPAEVTTITIGKELTKGLGAGGNPAIGKQAAADSVEELNEVLAGADMVFVAAGMGGGTGTGASPVIAGIAKQLGALTVGVVTKPFIFEGQRRAEYASQGIEDLKSKVDALIVIPNQRVLELVDRNVSFAHAMKKSDEVLLNAIKSISDIITMTGFMNVDFADVKAIMQDAGTALMGMGQSSNKDTRAIDASKLAINSPLLDYSIEGAKGVLVTVRGSNSMSLTEASEAVEVIKQYVSQESNIKLGVVLDESLGENLVVTVLATGFEIDPLDKDFEIRNQRVASLPIHRSESSNTSLTGSSSNLNSSGVYQQKSSNNTTKPNSKKDDGDDELDIPAFMRRRNG